MKRQARKADFLVIAQRAYNTVETALWAGLAAFAIYFAVFVAPQIPANRAAYDAARLHAIAAERDYYCEKWDKRAGTREHALCELDLQEYRARIEHAYAEDGSY